MPIYTWRCEGCKREVETINEIKNSHLPPEEVCPACGDIEKWEKLVSHGVKAAGNLQKGNYNSYGG